jgi:hypothetical protein
MINHCAHSFIRWQTMLRPVANKAKANPGVLRFLQWKVT